MNEWRSYYRERALEHFVDATVIFCRHPRVRGTCAFRMQAPPGDYAHEHLVRIRRAIERGVDGVALHELRRRTCRVAPEVTLDVTLTRDRGTWANRRTRASWVGGLAIDVGVNPLTAKVLVALDETTSLDNTIVRVCDELGAPYDMAADEVLDDVQRLAQCALLQVDDPRQVMAHA